MLTSLTLSREKTCIRQFEQEGREIRKREYVYFDFSSFSIQIVKQSSFYTRFYHKTLKTDCDKTEKYYLLLCL